MLVTLSFVEFDCIQFLTAANSEHAPPSYARRLQHELFVKVILRRATDTLMHMRMGRLTGAFHGPGGFIPIIV